MPPRVSTIIVTWNMAELVQECLDRLLQQTQTELEVIIVDNASQDATVDIVRRKYPSVKVIANAENAGYARANNQAIPLCRGEYLFLHNTDAMVIHDAVDRMVDFMDANPKVGVLGPKLLNVDGSLQRWTGGAFPSPGSAFSHFFLLSRLFPSRPLFRGMYLAHDFDHPVEVDWVSSASFMLRARAVQQVGMLDESFFAYMEDVDICQRMKKAGWAVFYHPGCRVTHYMGQNTLSRAGRVSPSSIRSLHSYSRRQHGPFQTALLILIEALGFSSRALAYSLGSRLTGRDAWAYKASLHRQYLRLCLEKSK